MASIVVDENGNPITPAAAPAAPAPAPGASRSIVVDENGQPVTPQAPDFFHRNIAPYLGLAQPGDTSTSAYLRNLIGWREATDQEKVQGASGIRAVAAPLDFLASVAQGFGNRLPAPIDESTGWANATTGTPTLTPEKGPAFQPVLPSEALISATGMTPNPNESAGLKTEESILPWLVPTPGTASRIAEAPSLVGKAVAGAGSTAMGAADWALSNEAQEQARQHGYGPMAQTVAGIAAPLARGAAFRTVGGIAHSTGGAEEGGEWYDLNRAEGRTPPFTEVASPAVQEFQNRAGSIPFLSPTLIGHMLGGPHGAAVGAALATGGRFLSHAVDDPSVVRAFAGRGLIAPLVQQYVQRASLGALPNPPPSPVTDTIMNYLKPYGAAQ